MIRNELGEWKLFTDKRKATKLDIISSLSQSLFSFQGVNPFYIHHPFGWCFFLFPNNFSFPINTITASIKALSKNIKAGMYMKKTDSIVSEIERRIELIERRRYDDIKSTEDYTEIINQTMSKIIGSSLIRELESLRDFILSQDD